VEWSGRERQGEGNEKRIKKTLTFGRTLNNSELGKGT
jgi:hypothetical protein